MIKEESIKTFAVVGIMQIREKQILPMSHEKQKKGWIFSEILLNDSSGWNNQGGSSLGHLRSSLLPNSTSNAKPFMGNVKKKKKVSNSSGEEWKLCLFLTYKMTNRELGLLFIMSLDFHLYVLPVLFVSLLKSLNSSVCNLFFFFLKCL